MRECSTVLYDRISPRSTSSFGKAERAVVDQVLREPLEGYQDPATHIEPLLAQVDATIAAEQPESIWAENRAGISEIIAGEFDVLPAGRCEVDKWRVQDCLAATTQDIER